MQGRKGKKMNMKMLKKSMIENGKMKTIKLLVIFALMIFAIPPAFACYGKTAEALQGSSGPLVKIVDEELTSNFGMHGRQNVRTAPLKISPELAHAIAKRFLDSNFQLYEHFAFEAFTFEHGKYVYMFDAEIPGRNLEVSTGQCMGNDMNAETSHMHFHVDALNGDVYGLGCGGGPGRVVMSFNKNDYPTDLQTKSMQLTQFKTDFIAQKSSALPKIDGKIEEDEWKDSGIEDLHFGPYEAHVKAKIDDKNIYFAIEVNTENWIALLLKDNPHHGMLREFRDAKLLQNGNVEDYYLVDGGMMATPYMAKDHASNLISGKGIISNGKSSYEFAFPLANQDSNDNSWDYGTANNIMLWVGSEKAYTEGVDPDSWISSQPILWIGEASNADIFEGIRFNGLSASIPDSKPQNDSFWSRLVGFFKSFL